MTAFLSLNVDDGYGDKDLVIPVAKFASVKEITGSTTTSQFKYELGPGIVTVTANLSVAQVLALLQATEA